MYNKPIQGKPPASIMRAMPAGTKYLGEDATYWYFVHPGANPHLGGFFDKIGTMFTRMVKFTPKSFTPGNIYRSVINTTVATATGGFSLLLPSKLQSQIQNIAKVAVPVVAAGAFALSNPSVMAFLTPKLEAAGSILGKAASSLGGNLFNFLGKLAPAQQAKVAQQITPQDIANMEQSAQIPANLVPLFQQAAAASLPQPTTGAASLYSPDAGTQPTQAGMVDLGGFDWKTGLMIGLPVLFFMLQPQGGRKR